MSALLDVTDPAAARPATPPRLVALDLDGTCLDSRQQLHPRIREAVRATLEHGVTVAVASGRMYRSALPWAREMRVVAPLICYQGAVLRALPHEGAPLVDGVPMGDLLFEDPLSPEAALAGLELARRGGWHRQAYQDERLLCEEDRPEAHLYARIAGVPITYVDDLEPLLHRGTTKLACVVDDEAGANRCETQMRELLGARARVTRSLPPFVEVTSPQASKGRALRALCDRLGVDIDATVAVGDAPNDADMLATAGYAVAVAGGRPQVAQAADALCAPPERGGVADVLEVLGLTG